MLYVVFVVKAVPQFKFDLLAHTPDNSFLGFAVTQKTNEDVTTKKKHWALVYGKQNYMWKVCKIN